MPKGCTAILRKTGRNREGVDWKTTGRKKGGKNRVYGNVVIDYFRINNTFNRVRHD
jgi:hypothetical protein